MSISPESVCSSPQDLMFPLSTRTCFDYLIRALSCLSQISITMRLSLASFLMLTAQLGIPSLGYPTMENDDIAMNIPRSQVFEPCSLHLTLFQRLPGAGLFDFSGALGLLFQNNTPIPIEFPHVVQEFNSALITQAFSSHPGILDETEMLFVEVPNFKNPELLVFRYGGETWNSTVNVNAPIPRCFFETPLAPVGPGSLDIDAIAVCFVPYIRVVAETAYVVHL
ncbi:hypothetical protein F5Y16DRAFT_143802 [Xylariaceae sp. FL0255]|nr:hypothetical protein F5Y16DRAFT_143802 [Xylariaceae sp. FL0255]